MSGSGDSRDERHAIVATAEAAVTAARDTVAVEWSTAELTFAVQDVASGLDAVAATARSATASTVAAAASVAAEVAAAAALAVRAQTAVHAAKVEAAALAAVQNIVAELPEDVNREWARRVAATVASTVATEVVAQAQLADDAATKVGDAVELAAEGAALAALAAASIVEVAARSASEVADAVAGSSLEVRTASHVAVESTARVAELAMRRASLLYKAPLVLELRRALEQDELRLHYQPMYSMSSGAFVAVEALLRWEHPTRGLLPPTAFLDVAEGPQLITPIGDWVLETAAAQAAQWQRDVGERAPRMWVNISCDQLGRRHLVGVLERLLDAHQLVPGSLGVEVTERQLARRLEDVSSDLTELRDLQVPLAVDDFGTGYASLDYLRRFAFDEVKIDRSFVAGLPDRINVAIISSIIALGDSLGLGVVAEGVETQQQHNRLQDLGCGFAQGYLLQRPAAAEVISGLLGARPGGARSPTTGTTTYPANDPSALTG
jgi:EAL domain-containing protein (putative c-di-GMP-specific phosphodiesterase class I)